MPESESADETLGISGELIDWLGIDSTHEDISPILRGLWLLSQTRRAICRVVPDYGPGYRSKIVLPSVVDSDRYRIYSVVVQP